MPPPHGTSTKCSAEGTCFPPFCRSVPRLASRHKRLPISDRRPRAVTNPRAPVNPAALTDDVALWLCGFTRLYYACSHADACSHASNCAPSRHPRTASAGIYRSSNTSSGFARPAAPDDAWARHSSRPAVESLRAVLVHFEYGPRVVQEVTKNVFSCIPDASCKESGLSIVSHGLWATRLVHLLVDQRSRTDDPTPRQCTRLTVYPLSLPQLPAAQGHVNRSII